MVVWRMEDFHQDTAPRAFADLEDDVPVGMADSGWDYKYAETSRPQGAYGGLVVCWIVSVDALRGNYRYLELPSTWFLVPDMSAFAPSLQSHGKTGIYREFRIP